MAAPNDNPPFPAGLIDPVPGFKPRVIVQLREAVARFREQSVAQALERLSPERWKAVAAQFGGLKLEPLFKAAEPDANLQEAIVERTQEQTLSTLRTVQTALILTSSPVSSPGWKVSSWRT
jgi:hypothetical protein